MELFLFALALLFLTFWSAYFSASEIALFSLPSTKIRSYQFSPDPRKQLIARLVLQPRNLLVTVFMMNTLVNILLQNVSSAMFGSVSSWLLRVGFPLVLTLFFGEIIPKYIALQVNEKLSYIVAPGIDFFTRILRPIREWTVAVTSVVSRSLFFFLKKEKNISKEELQHVLQTSEQSGVLHKDESELINGYLDLRDAQVIDLMRPREEILYFDLDEPLTKLIHLFADQECTRIPVCIKGIDTVIGIVTAQDYFLNRPKFKSTEDIKSILIPPYYVPETTQAKLVLRRFAQKNETLALIVDEYGMISGLLSSEDLFEAVVGEIVDRRDQEQLYVKTGNDVIIASGKLELEELEELTGVSLVSENNMMTIAGWLIEQLGEIPKSGTKFETNELVFQVLAADPNRVKRLYIRMKNRTKKKS